MTNIQGLNVKRLEKGRYRIEGWEVWDVPGTTGWRAIKDGERDRWFETLRAAKNFIARRKVS